MKIVAAIALVVVSLSIGVLGIAVFIGVGEGPDNAIAAFAAVSIPFVLLTGFFSWLMPRARWAVAVAMSATLVILCVIGAPMGWVCLPGAVWTALCTAAGVYFGRRLSQTRLEILPPGSQGS